MKGLKKEFGHIAALAVIWGIWIASPPLPLVAQGNVAAESVPSNPNPVSSAQITADINIDVSGTSPAEVLGSFTGTLKWDAAVLSFVSHSGLKAGFTGIVNTSSAGSGQLSFNGASASGVGGKSNVLTLTFNVIGASGTGTAIELRFTAMSAALTFKNLLALLSVCGGAANVGAAKPTLTASPASLAFMAAQGGTNPAVQILNITNTGTGTLSWCASDDQPWLSTKAASGTTTTETDQDTILVDITGLAAGIYNGKITLTGSGANGSPKSIPVTLTINPSGGDNLALAESMPSNANPNPPPPSSQITVDINIDVSGTKPAELLGSFTGTLKWDVAVLSFVSHSGLKSGFTGVVNTSSAGSGQLSFNGASPSGASGKSNVLTCTFNVVGANGAGTVMDLKFTAMSAALTFNNLLPVLTVCSGAVNIGSARPTLQVMPASLNFSTPPGTNPPFQTLNIKNAGTGIMSWCVTDNQPWLSVRPASGTTVAETDLDTISINVADLTAGTYNAVITVKALGATASPITIPVTLTIGQIVQPVLVVNPASLSFAAPQGGANPPDQIFNITNGGSGTMNWSVSDDQPWLTASPPNGNTTTETDPVTASVNITGLTAGTYNAAVTVTAPGALGSPKVVQVTLVITPVVIGKVTARVVCPAADPNTGSSITIPIFVNMADSPPPDDKLGSLSGSLKWDHAVLQYSSHSGLKSGFTGVVNTGNVATGQLTFNGANPNGTAADVNVIDVTFTVIGSGGATTILDLGFTAIAAALTFTNLLPILTTNDCSLTVQIITPVELTSFTVSVVSNVVELNWTTASETNNYGFEVQRSADQTNFQRIGFVVGNGTTTSQHMYKFSDRDLAAGTYYYRLKQIDTDGTITFSGIVRADLAAVVREYALQQNYPNPFNPATTIAFDLKEDGPVKLLLFNMLGRQVAELINGQLKAGSHTAILDARTFASGTYIYVLEVNSFRTQKRLQIIK